jgi:hypothetical protein
MYVPCFVVTFPHRLAYAYDHPDDCRSFRSIFELLLIFVHFTHLLSPLWSSPCMARTHAPHITWHVSNAYILMSIAMGAGGTNFHSSMFYTRFTLILFFFIDLCGIHVMHA